MELVGAWASQTTGLRMPAAILQRWHTASFTSAHLRRCWSGRSEPRKTAVTRLATGLCQCQSGSCVHAGYLVVGICQWRWFRGLSRCVSCRAARKLLFRQGRNYLGRALSRADEVGIAFNRRQDAWHAALDVWCLFRLIDGSKEIMCASHPSLTIAHFGRFATFRAYNARARPFLSLPPFPSFPTTLSG
jgi:hypothetical protein